MHRQMIHTVRAIRVTLQAGFAQISGDFLMNVLDMFPESAIAHKCGFTARTRETIATVFTFVMCNQLELVLKKLPRSQCWYFDIYFAFRSRTNQKQRGDVPSRHSRLILCPIRLARGWRDHKETPVEYTKL